MAFLSEYGTRMKTGSEPTKETNDYVLRVMGVRKDKEWVGESAKINRFYSNFTPLQPSPSLLSIGTQQSFSILGRCGECVPCK